MSNLLKPTWILLKPIYKHELLSYNIILLLSSNKVNSLSSTAEHLSAVFFQVEITYTHYTPYYYNTYTVTLKCTILLNNRGKKKI